MTKDPWQAAYEAEAAKNKTLLELCELHKEEINRLKEQQARDAAYISSLEHETRLASEALSH